MKKKLVVLSLIVLPAFVHAQNMGGCANIIYVSKDVSDNFQSLQNDAARAEIKERRARTVSGEVHLRFRDCEKSQGAQDAFKVVDELLQTAVADKKTVDEAFAKVEATIRQFIADSHGQVVENFYVNPNAGPSGEVVTTVFRLDGNKIVFNITEDPLQPLVH